MSECPNKHAMIVDDSGEYHSKSEKEEDGASNHEKKKACLFETGQAISVRKVHKEGEEH